MKQWEQLGVRTPGGGGPDTEELSLKLLATRIREGPRNGAGSPLKERVHSLRLQINLDHLPNSFSPRDPGQRGGRFLALEIGLRGSGQVCALGRGGSSGHGGHTQSHGHTRGSAHGSQQIATRGQAPQADKWPVTPLWHDHSCGRHCTAPCQQHPFYPPNKIRPCGRELCPRLCLLRGAGHTVPNSFPSPTFNTVWTTVQLARLSAIRQCLRLYVKVHD